MAFVEHIYYLVSVAHQHLVFFCIVCLVGWLFLLFLSRFIFILLVEFENKRFYLILTHTPIARITNKKITESFELN